MNDAAAARAASFAKIGSNTRMWVAVFDHAQTYHTRHIRPVRLELQR